MPSASIILAKYNTFYSNKILEQSILVYFLSILSRVLDSNLVGSHLIYSQFRTLEGIGILSLVLNTNGFAQFRISKTGGEWRLNIKPEDMNKPKYIFYTGTELPEEKEILRNIFNSNWDALDTPETNSLKREFDLDGFPVKILFKKALIPYEKT